jgi:hypothetical protein
MKYHIEASNFVGHLKQLMEQHRLEWMLPLRKVLTNKEVQLVTLKSFLQLRRWCTVKPVYNGQPWDPKIMAVVDRWSLFRGRVYL